MLKRPRDTYLELVWEAVARVGRNAARVTNEIIYAAFPKTAAAAEEEAAFHHFRNGLMKDVKTVIRGPTPDEAQIDFAPIDESFHSLVKTLKSHAYYVPSLDAQVPIEELIESPDHLAEAEKFMRKKGDECYEEAGRLKLLHEAVVERRTAG